MPWETRIWCPLLLLRVSNVVLGWVLHLSSSASNRPFIWSSVLLSSALIKVNKMYSTPSITLTAVALASSVALYVGANQQYVKSTHTDEILAWVFGHISFILPSSSSHSWPSGAENIWCTAYMAVLQRGSPYERTGSSWELRYRSSCILNTGLARFGKSADCENIGSVIRSAPNAVSVADGLSRLKRASLDKRRD